MRSDKPTLLFTRDILLIALTEYTRALADERFRKHLTEPNALANFLSDYFAEAGDPEIAKAFEKAVLS